MIRLREYRDGDIDAISDAIESTVLDSQCRELYNDGLFVTLEKDGKPVATGGLVIKDENTAEAWAKVDVSIGSKSERKALHRLLRAFSEALELISESLGFPVVYACVQDGFKGGERFARALKFERIEESFDKDGKQYNYYRRAS